MESVSNTKQNTSIGQCHPISASENQRQDLEALQRSAARATGIHELFPVTWRGGAASAESICRHAQNVFWKKGIFKKPKICSANCATHEHGVKHDSPVPSAVFHPNCKQSELPRRAVRRAPSRLGAEQSCLASEYLPLDLGPGQLVFAACKLKGLYHH